MTSTGIFVASSTHATCYQTVKHVSHTAAGKKILIACDKVLTFQPCLKWW